ncbi:DUF6069 family protein [Haloprofundus salilacus]|uniref:DUF6069 family protein n=1 Tax=Haloprofundus salilacus TaxID=2876190 RepID=UPI001CCAD172|nr:DUF6069 family protein [Haloprofundus salilacus]
MVSTTAMNKAKSSSSVGTFQLAKFGLLALLVASIVNILVLYLGLANVEFPSEFVGGPFGPLAVGPVIINSAVAAIGATLVYGVVNRYSARPNRTFTIIAGVFLVLSFAMFLTPNLSGAPLNVFAILTVMHVTTAVTIIGVLTRATNPEVESR